MQGRAHLRAAVAIAVVGIAIAVPLTTAHGQSSGCPGADLEPDNAETSSLESATLCLINQVRADNGLGALRFSGELQVPARSHANDMQANDYFSHTGQDGSTPASRVAASGYRNTFIGELIGWGTAEQGTPRARVEAWLASSNDRAVMLAKAANEIGIGVVHGAPSQGTQGGATYTAELGHDGPPEPVVGQSVVVEPVSGTVTIRLPGSASSHGAERTLEQGETIPVGSIVDATSGVVRMTSASNLQGAKQRAIFYEGAFKVRQKRAKRPVTELLMRGAISCTHGATAAKKKVRRRHLWGNGKGRYRTRGRNASATVRGTIWLTENRCDGTYVKVKRGIVDVAPVGKRYFKGTRTRLVRVKAGHSYLAK